MSNKILGALIVTLIVGVFLSLFAFNTNLMAGHIWLTERANQMWNMNNYIAVPGNWAFILFGVLMFYLGGVFAGVALPVFFSWWHTKKVMIAGTIALLAAFLMSMLGFNTLDWMLGSVYWAGTGPAANVNFNLFSMQISVDAWNTYFFVVLVPLWLSGFLLSVSSTIMVLVSCFLKD